MGKTVSLFLEGVWRSNLGININNLIEQIAIYSPKRGQEESLNPEDNFNQKYVFPSGTFS